MAYANATTARDFGDANTNDPRTNVPRIVVPDGDSDGILAATLQMCTNGEENSKRQSTDRSGRSLSPSPRLKLLSAMRMAIYYHYRLCLHLSKIVS